MKSFTIIELLLVIALLTIVAGISIPFFSRYDKDSSYADLEIISDSMRSAEILSMSQKSNSSWGVHLEDDRVITFSGDDYRKRNTKNDRVAILNSVYVFSGPNSIYFDLSGKTESEGDVIILSKSNFTKKLLITRNNGFLILND